MQSLEKLKPLALLALRVALGVIFIFHGKPKLFGQTANFMQFFVKVGFPAWFVYVSGVLEFFGGCLLIAGLFTRVVGLLLAAEMAIAIWKVHMGGGIYAVKNYEFPLVVGTAALTLAAVGAGLISLDQILYRGGSKSGGKTKPDKK